jgi:hypothetical protein
MKTLTVVGTLLISSLIFASGCATTRAQLSPQTATSLVDLRHALSSGKIHLERTSQALRDLVDNPRSNTQRQIDLFIDEMADLEVEAQRIRDINTRMQARAAEHIEAWDKEVAGIENPEIARAAKSRQEETHATMEAIRAKLDDAKEVLSPYMSNLRDTERYLRQDQTVDGVLSLTPIIRKTLSMQSRAMRQLDGIIAHIDDVTRSVE